MDVATNHALISFSYHLTIGEMDEAHRAVKKIKVRIDIMPYLAVYSYGDVCTVICPARPFHTCMWLMGRRFKKQGFVHTSSRLITRTLSCKYGLPPSDTNLILTSTVYHALISFSYNLTIGEMDGAHRAVKKIKVRIVCYIYPIWLNLLRCPHCNTSAATEKMRRPWSQQARQLTPRRGNSRASRESG